MSYVNGRALRRRKWPIMGGRSGAVDRGRPTGRVRYGRAVDEGLARGRRATRKATARNPITVRAENRRRNRQARASRKRNRG